jgi:hypothetical protein
MLMIDHGSVTPRPRSLIAALLLLASSLTSVAPAPANALQAASTRTPAASPQQTPAAQQPAAQSASPMGNDQALYLVRSTLLTLNDANRSGNYTVLRDLAAPDFRAKNTAADLAQSFADLRRRNFDLFAAALIAPQFAAPALDARGRVHLTGVFPTRPLQISFDMTFEALDGQWRLFAISVTTPGAPQTRP